MRVLVTGHRGYFGSVLTRVLTNARFDVVGLDNDLYSDSDFGRVQEIVPSFDMDIRDVEFADLLSFDVVIHLAGVAYMSGSAVPAATARDVNHQATIRLAQACREAEVTRFILASSCSVYGHAQGHEMLTEQSIAQPPSAVAAARKDCEDELAAMTSHRFQPVIIRHAEMYGVSPRLRLDLLVNDLVASAVTSGRVASQTAEFAWRPFVHVEDAARVYARLLAAPADAVSGQVFNLVSPEQNRRVVDLEDEVCEAVSGSRRCRSRAHDDHRSYRVDGSKLIRTLKDFTFRWKMRRGIEQLRNAFVGAGLSRAEWRGVRYRRAESLRILRHEGQLDEDLRPPELAVTSASPASAPV